MVHPGCLRGDGDPRAATIRDGPGRPRRRDRGLAVHDPARKQREPPPQLGEARELLADDEVDFVRDVLPSVDEPNASFLLAARQRWYDTRQGFFDRAQEAGRAARATPAPCQTSRSAPARPTVPNTY